MRKEENKEKTLRKVAALILAETYRSRPVYLDSIREIAEKNGCSLEDFMNELRERFYCVGVVLREIEDVVRGRKKIAVFGVIDPELDISIGWIDKTSAAILAVMYIKSEVDTVSLDTIYDEVAKILGSEKEAQKVLERVLYYLEKKRLIKIDPEKRLVKISPLGRALLPDKEKLDEIIVNVLISEKRKKND